MWVLVDRKTERILAAGPGEGAASNHDMSVGYLLDVREQVIELIEWRDRLPVNREVYLRDLRQHEPAELDKIVADRATKKAESAAASTALADLVQAEVEEKPTIASLATRIARLEAIAKGLG